MKVIIIIACAAVILGFGGGNYEIGGLGVVVLLALIAWRFLVWSGRKTKGAISNSMAERREEKEFQKNLRRDVQRERELAKVRNQSTIELLTAQVNLIASHKREGLNVEREIYEMRAKLLEYERTENSAMVDDLKKILDGL